MRRPLALALALALSSPLAFSAPAAPTAIAAGRPADAVTTQLPRNVRPVHYTLAVTPHAETLSFDGEVAIDLEVLEATDLIALNQWGMQFSRVELTRIDDEAAPVLVPKIDASDILQRAVFTFGQELKPGAYRLSLTYTGKIGTQANGLFALDYATPEGKKRGLFTQFENSDARRFVPSWDEPNHKATFDLTVTVPAAQMAISNMPVAERREAGEGLVTLKFERSPKMSTYLLFFALGDFEREDIVAADGTKIGVIAQKGKVDQARFALESSKDVLAEYNDYFGVKYPLPKLDNIAAPGRSQFFSAMENWGAIFTFEHTLLLDPAIANVSDRQRIFSVAAHEIAHQWFGNLVTMAWWDDLWLNEGFATWMAARTTQKLHPEWNTAIGAVYGREGAMGRDAVASTHPVVQHIETVEQASQAFDAITYAKGGAVIRMLEAYVGADAWRDGVRQYIAAHAYGNAVSDDLWKQIETAANLPVTAIAHDFTLQPGIPMLRVSARCEGGRTLVSFAQDEFTVDRPGKEALRWRVPVIAKVGGGAEVRALVEDGKGGMALPGCGALLVNAGQSGYYRTLYAPEQFDALRGGFGELSTIDQLGVMRDVWALSMNGDQPVSDYLGLADATPVGADPEIWMDVAGNLSGIDAMFDGKKDRQAAFRKYAIARLAPVFATLGWQAREDDSAPVRRLRMTLIGTLASLGDEAVIAEARRRFAASETDAGALPAELRRTVLQIVASQADAAMWEKLHGMAKAETSSLLRDQYYALLASPRDEALARRALQLALTSEPGATNGAAMIRTVAESHPDMAFDFAVEHREQVDELVDSTSRARYYPGLAGGSARAEMVAKLRAFAQKNIAPSSRRDMETAIANIETRIKQRGERLPEIEAWLKQRGG